MSVQNTRIPSRFLDQGLLAPLAGVTADLPKKEAQNNRRSARSENAEKLLIRRETRARSRCTSVPAATAILDRFLHNAEVIAITGKSYRLRNRAASDEVQQKQEGRRTADDSVVSPPEDTEPLMALSSCAGVAQPET